MSIQRYGFNQGNGYFGLSSASGEYVKFDDHMASHQFDEQRERKLFESSSIFPEGVYWSEEFKAYRSINMRPVEASDALDATMRLQGWIACAKSRAVK